MKVKSKAILILSLFLLLFEVSGAGAGTLTIQGQTTPPPVTMYKDADLTVTIARVVGTTVYTDASAGWSSTPAQFRANGAASTVVLLTIPANISLVRSGGTETATLNFACRVGATDAYPTSKTQGTACGSTATASAAGWVYLALFPTDITFSVDTQGTYTGTVTITVNY